MEQEPLELQAPVAATAETPQAPAAAVAPSAADNASSESSGRPARPIGEAPIKPEFLKPIAPPPTVAQDGDGEEREKLRGTFKKRPIDAQEDPAELLCRPVAAGEACAFGDACKFSHDMGDYMRRKLKDLGSTCPVFESVGRCRFGLACRFAGAHVRTRDDGTFENVVDAERLARAQAAGEADGIPFERNALTHAVRTQLRKNAYAFASLGQKKKKGGGQHGRKPPVDSAATELASECVAPLKTETVEALAAVVAEPASESALLPERKPVDFKRKIYVAPLTTVGNLPFRRLLKQTGADITCGEMAMATNLLHAQQSEWALLRRHASEDVFGVQIAGGHGDQMARVCELLARETDVDFIDINMGCPIDIVCRAGAGASLMTRASRVVEVVSGGLTGIELGARRRGDGHVPGLTVKLRTGWSDKDRVAHKLVPKIQGARASSAFMSASVVQDYKLRAVQGVDAITVHGRSRLQRYTKTADWDYVFECSDAQDAAWATRTPFVGGGDVLSFEEFDAHLANGKLDTCMLARGALIKPWLPTEIKERRHWDISASERLDLLRDFVRFGLEHWGSDQKGVNRTRRYLLEWQSFLYRYIPVGLLEVLPQHINDRPSPYYGRNDLETLMASDRAGDWVKLSEMLLGPVPEGFQFVPKHKANSYG
ncbi:hypothetical protein PybrP1_000137 [[Pythium] brassicae (nom. inval.)]|nr:hypothetical protein PybrP1_000137 [[Pythium] brassicae (nom. inval.)]